MRGGAHCRVVHLSGTGDRAQGLWGWAAEWNGQVTRWPAGPDSEVALLSPSQLCYHTDFKNYFFSGNS